MGIKIEKYWNGLVSGVCGIDTISRYDVSSFRTKIAAEVKDFDANQFYPERLTLTYSDSLIVPSLMSAPFFWAGGNPVVIYNLLLLSGFVLSGVTMFLLVRADSAKSAERTAGGQVDRLPAALG